MSTLVDTLPTITVMLSAAVALIKLLQFVGLWFKRNIVISVNPTTRVNSFDYMRDEGKTEVTLVVLGHKVRYLRNKID